jgi:hypothetical protein
MPRLDYSNGSCPALLLEPSRTNLVTDSEYITQPVNGTNTYNQGISPEGVNNAVKYTADSTFPNIRFSGISITAGTQYTFSCFVKYVGYQWMYINFNAGFTNDFTDDCWFDIENGELGTIGSNITNSSIESYGNGWYRISATSTAVSTGTGQIRLHNTGGDNVNTLPSNETGLHNLIYGAQIEDATYPTSYIPTYGVSQTRLVDFASATNVASLIGQNEGSYFIEFQAKRLDEVYSMFSINDGTNNNRIQLTFTDSGTNPRISFFYFVNGVNAFQSTSIQNLVANQTYKFAVTYTQSSLSAYLDGTQIINETGLSLSGGTFNEIVYGLRASSSSFRFNMPVNQTLVFPTALSDEECIALTTI